MKSQMFVAVAVLLVTNFVSGSVAVAKGSESSHKSQSKSEPMTAEKVKKETSEAVDAAGTYAGEKKDEFAARMKNNIDAIDREIAELKRESASKSAEVRETTKTKIQELQTKRDELNARYAEFEKSTGKAWTRMKAGMEKAWGDVRSAYNEAKTELQTKK